MHKVKVGFIGAGDLVFFEIYAENGTLRYSSQYVQPGWLRSLEHAHYLFPGGEDPGAFIPGLAHGLEVQRLFRETASNLEIFRNNYYHG